MFCHRCGNPHKPQAQFCSRCGVSLELARQQSSGGYGNSGLGAYPQGSPEQVSASAPRTPIPSPNLQGRVHSYPPLFNAPQQAYPPYSMGSNQGMNGFPSGQANLGSLGRMEMLQGRYQIVDEIGRGGMGAAYLALDHRFAKRVCVVKVLLDTYRTDSEAAEAIRRFELEADTLAALSHPGIPYVFDRFNEGHRHYLVMEYIGGLDWNRLLQVYQERYQGPLPEEEMREFLYHMTGILDYLHNRKPPVFHRDIKPSNILIDWNCRIKLVDFGIAKALRKDYTRGTGIGTQGYASPEQYRGYCDERSDLYSLGATMHHLLTGRDPQMETPFDFPRLRTFNAQISPELEGLVDWMLRHNAEERPSGAEVIRKHLLELDPQLDQKIVKGEMNQRPMGRLVYELASRPRITQDGQPLCPRCLALNRPGRRFCKACGHCMVGEAKGE